MTISASGARAQLFPLIKKANDDHVPIRITSRGGDPGVTRIMEELEALAGDVGGASTSILTPGRASCSGRPRTGRPLSGSPV
ncbi:type II toxin-antitoxin system prevent-host-death family antitoxin [Kitasatospora sp. NPDC002551]|uniref:type II toxin-antitoxin system Phd/YefM family antitoxin n=1 Tax=unclassified Kitasatospora TaxID=2633591 RepID=UPI0033289CE1